MRWNNTVDIFHATVANFYGVFVKSCVEYGWLENVSSVILETLYLHWSWRFLIRVGWSK